MARFRTPLKPSLCKSEESKKFLFAFLPSLILKNPVSAKAMSEKRFVIHDSSVEEYVESLENKNTQGKTKRDVKLLNDFLRGETLKKEERELSAITPEDLDRYLAEFIRSVRREDGGEFR